MPYPYQQNYGYQNPYQQMPYQPLMQDRLAQLQNQYQQTVPQYAPVQQPQQQMLHLNGQVVDSLDVVKAKDVDLSGAAGPFSLAIAIDGEALASATGTVQAGGADEYNNIYVSVLIPVLRGTSVSVSVENTSAAAVNVQNANIIVERVA